MGVLVVVVVVRGSAGLRAPGVLTAVSRTQQPHLPSMKPFVTGERSSRKKGLGASLGRHEHLGPSISLSPLPRTGMPPPPPKYLHTTPRAHARISRITR